VWRYERFDLPEGTDIPEFNRFWDVFGDIPAPILLLRGGDSPVVGDEDVEELQRRRPDARVIVVEKAGHSIQGDQPLELARLVEAELAAG
jgi:pimeloyl-ACP methyl ester carboxylesterase